MVTPVTIVIKHVITGTPIHSLTTEHNSLATTVKDAIAKGISLNYADFAGADLRGVSFSHVKMKGVNFTKTNLANARFYKSRMMYVTFKDTNFYEANLEQATIKYSGIHDVNFTNAFAKNIHIIDCVASNWNLTNAVFRGAGLVRNRDKKGSKHIYDNTDLRGSFARQCPILHPQGTDKPVQPTERYKVPVITNAMLEAQGYQHLPKLWSTTLKQQENTRLYGVYLDIKQAHPELSDHFFGIDRMFCEAQEAFVKNRDTWTFTRIFDKITHKLNTMSNQYYNSFL